MLVKIVDIDETANVVIAKVWDETLKNKIDDYQPVSIQFSRLDFTKDIEPQLCSLLQGQLDFQKNLEAEVDNSHIELLKSLLGKEITSTDSVPLDGVSSNQDTYKNNWNSGK